MLRFGRGCSQPRQALGEGLGLHQVVSGERACVRTGSPPPACLSFLHAPRHIDALLLADLHSDCRAVSAKRAITDDTQSANHTALFLLPLLSDTRRFHASGRLALLHGFRMQVQEIRSDLDSSVMTLRSSLCPPSISVGSFFHHLSMSISLP